MKNTLTKVLTIVAASLVLAIAVTAIVLALVKTNFNQVIDTTKVEGITVYKSSGDNYYSKNSQYEDVKTEFNKMLKLYNKGTKESVISALFQGAYSSSAKAEVLRTSTSVSNIKNIASSKYVLKFDFSEEMKLVVNGETQTDSSISGTDKTIKYTSAYFVVEDNDTLTKVMCYIESTSNKSYSYIQVYFPTSHHELYKYISELEFPGA